MAKKRSKTLASGSTRAAPEHTPTPGAVSPWRIQSSGIRVQAIALRGLDYRELGPPPTPPVGAKAGSRVPMSVDLKGQINIYLGAEQQPLVELKLMVAVRPEPTIRPMQLDATIGALFTGEPEISLDALVRFVNESGAQVLFPYVREVVSAATSRGIFGPIFLDPVVMGSLTTEAEVQKLLTGHYSAIGRG